MRRLVLVVLAACSSRSTPTSSTIDGAQLFATHCARCHGETGKPDEAMVAQIGVRDLTAPEFRARVTPKLVETQVHEGAKNHLMPSFDGILSDAQIESLAKFVASPAFVQPAQKK